MDGILLIDKPAGITSHDVVARVRHALSDPGSRPISEGSLPAPGVSGRRSAGGRPKAGHAGTLDPFATGLLILLVGRATKLQQRFMALPKSYETIACLGARSSTGDREGEIEVTGRLPADPPILPIGTIRQRPPIYSAVKVGGERAYRRARRGEHVEMPEREVTLTRFTQLWREPPRAGGDGTCRAGFAIDCSSGTYVRSLIADLGDAYCLQLRRTAIGPFSVADAVAPPPRRESWPDAPLIEPADALAAISAYVT